MVAMTAVIGIKPGLASAALVELFRELCAPPSVAHLATFIQVGADGDERQRVEASKQALEEIGRELANNGYQWEPHTIVNSGSAGAQVAQLADSLTADLVFLGLGKRTRVGKALLGSDAQTAIVTAPCPVVTVRISGT